MCNLRSTATCVIFLGLLELWAFQKIVHQPATTTKCQGLKHVHRSLKELKGRRRKEGVCLGAVPHQRERENNQRCFPHRLYVAILVLECMAEHFRQMELRAVYVALKLFLLIVRHHHLLVHSGNTVMVSNIKHQGNIRLSGSLSTLYRSDKA